MDLVKRLAAKYPDYLQMAYTTDGVVHIHRARRIASMMGMEGEPDAAEIVAAAIREYEAANSPRQVRPMTA